MDFGKRFLSSSLYLISGKVFTFLFAIMYSVVLTRLFSANDVGVIFFWVSIVTLGAYSSLFGMNLLAVREYPQLTSNKCVYKFFCFGLTVVAVAALVLLALLSLYIYHFGLINEYMAVLTSNTPSIFVYFVCFTLSVYVLEFYRASGEIKYYSIIGAGQWGVITLATYIGVVIFDASIGYAFYALACASFVFLLISMVVLLLRVVNDRWADCDRFSEALSNKVVMDLSVYWVVSSLVIIVPHVILIFMGAKLSPEVVAKYAVAMRLVVGVSFIVLVVNHILGPIIARRKYENNGLQRSDFIRLFKLSSIVGLIGLVLWGVLVLIADRVILILFGVEYLEASESLLVVAFFQVVSVFVYFSYLILQIERKLIQLLLSVVVPFFLAVVLMDKYLSELIEFAYLHGALVFVFSLLSFMFVLFNLMLKKK